MKTIEYSLLDHQRDFVFDLDHEDQGFCGGYGAGKSMAACMKSIFLSAIHPGKEGALLSPTYGMTKRNLIPLFRAIRDKYDLKIAGLDITNPAVIHIKWGNKWSKIHLEISAQNHDRLNGLNLAWAGFDEADKCRTAEIAETAWMQMGARLRDTNPNAKGIRFATSTPEGFGFMYNTFVENKSDSKILYRASMLDNYLLPKNYIQQQLQSLPKHLHKPYILGEFANIHSNIVYCEFDRVLNHTNLTLKDMLDNEVLHIGVDMNNNGMSAVGFIRRGEYGYAVYECIGSLNTKSLCQKLKADLIDNPIMKNKKVIIYPDPAATQNKSNSDQTDLAIIRSFNFNVKIMSSHPEIQDRVNSVNARFNNINDERRFFINTQTCPLTTKAFLQQTYNSDGVPTKKERLAGTTHTYVDGPLDAIGYGIYTHWPLRNQRAKKIEIRGF